MTKKLFEDYSDILKSATNYLAKRDKENLISFVEGHSKNRGDKELIDYLRLYLYHNCHINMEYNTWTQQVEHYSYTKELDWFNGFYELLNEIIEKQQELEKQDDIPNDDFIHEIPRGEKKEFVHLGDNVIIKPGDRIRLGDKIGEEYKQTRFYDASLSNPSWDLFYPSNKDFKHIDFYHKGNKYFEADTNHLITTFGKVRRLLSDSIVEIKELAIHRNEIIIYTDLFRIEAKQALQEHEIKVLSKQVQDITLTDLSGLDEKIQEYEMGLFSIYDLTKEINNWCFFGLGYLKKEWHKYRFSMGMKWDKLEK